MEKVNEVNREIGKQNVKIILAWIKKGEIKEDKLKQMAKQMHDEVHGVFVEKRRWSDPEDVFRYMLDKWYTRVLYKSDVDGYDEMVRVLNEIDLEDLVAEMNK